MAASLEVSVAAIASIISELKKVFYWTKEPDWRFFLIEKIFLLFSWLTLARVWLTNSSGGSTLPLLHGPQYFTNGHNNRPIRIKIPHINTSNPKTLIQSVPISMDFQSDREGWCKSLTFWSIGKYQPCKYLLKQVVQTSCWKDEWSWNPPNRWPNQGPLKKFECSSDAVTRLKVKTAKVVQTQTHFWVP